MTAAVAIAVVILVLAAMNVWVHLGSGPGVGLGADPGYGRGSGRVDLLAGPLASLLLLLVARSAGLTWEQLGLGRGTWLRGVQLAVAAAAIVAVGYAVAVAVPFTRGAFRDTRYRLGLREALYAALVAIPLGTVLFEEVAFRGVLWALLVREFGTLAATAVSAGVFGLWHVLPAMDLAETHTQVAGHTTSGPRRVVVTVLATVAFTSIAGIVFAELRRRSGSLVAPIGLHWATNGLGVLAAARVWAVSADDPSAPERPETGRTRPARPEKPKKPET